jgi:N,N'-diacetyllegionaminate synthase
MKQKVRIIAEAGVNHNGDMNLARELVRQAALAGADYIKFQAFHPDYLVHPSAQTAPYQEANTGGEKHQLDMLRKYALSADQLLELKLYAQACKIDFVCSVFDLPSLAVLEELKETTIKIPSGEIDHIPLLQAVAKLQAEVWLSTGMASMNEIRLAIETLLASGLPPGNIILLQCHSQYPTLPQHANLKALTHLENFTGLPVGYSDHTQGIACAIAAVALGAILLEKHFTLDNNLPGPDHSASLNPTEFKNMVQAIREIESAMGDGIKKPETEELLNKPFVRKGIYAKRDIKEGELLKPEDLICLRPAQGRPASDWHFIANTPALKAYKAYEPI